MIVISEYTENEISQILTKKNLRILSDFDGIYKKYEMIDNNGYKYCLSIHNFIYGDYTPMKFHKRNPYTIYNIRKYLDNNNISCKLISEEYTGSNKLLKWECKCGNYFERSLEHVIRGQITCKQCSDKHVENAKLYSIDFLKEKLLSMNLLYIDKTCNYYSNGCYAFTNDGYIVHINRSALYNEIIPRIFDKHNKYSLFNINRYFDLYRDGEYKCVSKKYVSNIKKMKFIHIKCGMEFEAPLCDMKLHNNEKGIVVARKCPYCYKSTLESFHACVLKQVFKHEYPDTVLEDKSCINPKTQRILPTDIVNHGKKIAIEIQSKFHDNEYQKEKDEIKKKYWLNNGYSYYSVDIRNYTIVEMINIFFPHINEIPLYVKTNFEDTNRYEKAQKLINCKKFTYKEIANKLNICVATLYYWNKKGKINLQCYK